jgi:hypothetical protein
MALGATTYKTPNIINLIGSDLTSKEGCGVTIPYGTPNQVNVATAASDFPYGVVVTGTDSLTPGTYPSAIGDAALELVDQLGCVVQVLISANGGVVAGDALVIDNSDGDGTFTTYQNQVIAEGNWVWGFALTDADSSQQCLMRFQPVQVQYIAPPPAP